MDYKYLATNIERLRKQRDLSIIELCERANISPPAYRSIRDNESEPRQSTISSIAKGLNVSFIELIKPAPNSNLKFEEDKFKEFERGQIKYEIEDKLKKFRYLYKILDKPQPKTDFLTKMREFYKNYKSPKDLANKARELFDLGDLPILDIVHLFVKKAGIEVIPFTSDFDIFSACIFDDEEGGAAICINTRRNITAERQIFVCVHELAHLIKGENSCNSDHMRSETDIFAGNFLAPEQKVIDKLIECKGLHIIDQIIQVKNHFSISYRTLIHRIAEYNSSSSEEVEKKYQKLKQSFIEQYLKREGKRLEDRDEPSPIPKLYFKEDKLNCLVREAFEMKKIKIAEAAEILNISKTKFEEISNSWSSFSF